MTTFTLNSLLPIQADGEKLDTYCRMFNLSLVEWEKSAYKITLKVNETLTPERLAEIATAFNNFLMARLITLGEYSTQ